mmetsp:Transcript_5865/g.23744  ORF Transcript_5865/g.23744 Transcript_5865/m.23744 type:complete len:207 (-) Transcript_5865:968-1588(-)
MRGTSTTSSNSHRSPITLQETGSMTHSCTRGTASPLARASSIHCRVPFAASAPWKKPSSRTPVTTTFPVSSHSYALMKWYTICAHEHSHQRTSPTTAPVLGSRSARPKRARCFGSYISGCFPPSMRVGRIFMEPSNSTIRLAVTQKSCMNVAPCAALCHSDVTSDIFPVSPSSAPSEMCGGYTGLNPKKCRWPVSGATFGCAVNGT